jgi:DNA-binding MarR family transcriptional regulator
MPSSSVSYIRMRLLHGLECDGDQTMSALANALGVTQRRVTALVDALEEEGFVERMPHPTDGRSTVVTLTRAGRARQNVDWEDMRNEIGLVFGDLPVEQQRQLLEITPVLTEALRRRSMERAG